MKNLILKHGDLVRVKRSSRYIDACGLSIGAVCQVGTDETGRLTLTGPRGAVPLTDLDGALTDACDALTRVRGEALPRGAVPLTCPVLTARRD